VRVYLADYQAAAGREASFLCRVDPGPGRRADAGSWRPRRGAAARKSPRRPRNPGCILSSRAAGQGRGDPATLSEKNAAWASFCQACWGASSFRYIK